eukprot:2139788-Prymnesium_polylepis.1
MSACRPPQRHRAANRVRGRGRCLQHAIAVLDVVAPLAVVLVAVGERVHAAAVHLAVDPLALVDAAVSVQILAIAGHLAVAPITLRGRRRRVRRQPEGTSGRLGASEAPPFVRSGRASMRWHARRSVAQRCWSEKISAPHKATPRRAPAWRPAPTGRVQR